MLFGNVDRNAQGHLTFAGHDTVSLSKEAIINGRLDNFFGGVRERLKPIGVSCREDGIRLELISGLADAEENEAWYVYSLEDPEGAYEGYSYRTYSMRDKRKEK